MVRPDARQPVIHPAAMVSSRPNANQPRSAAAPSAERRQAPPARDRTATARSPSPSPSSSSGPSSCRPSPGLRRGRQRVHSTARASPDPKEPLDDIEFDQQTLVYDRTGKVELARFGQQKREVIDFDDLPPRRSSTRRPHRGQHVLGQRRLRSARHRRRPPIDTIRGRSRGASTITQQLVRARLLPDDVLAGSHLDRKIKEIIQSIRLTQAFPGDAGKREIMSTT